MLSPRKRLSPEESRDAAIEAARTLATKALLANNRSAAPAGER